MMSQADRSTTPQIAALLAGLLIPRGFQSRSFRPTSIGNIGNNGQGTKTATNCNLIHEDESGYNNIGRYSHPELLSTGI
jgi:hypothetical protein